MSRHRTPPTVIVRYDEDGEVEFYAEGDVRLLIVDERCSDGRVYEITDRYTRAQVADIIGDDKIGTRFDGSEAAKKLGQSGVN